MAVADRTRGDNEMRGRITADGVQRYRNRIGVLIPQPPPFNNEAHADTIRHFATAYGDDNPLYADPEYAKSTRWGTTPAPPMFVSTMGVTHAPPIPKHVRDAGAGALRGVPWYQSGSDWQWFRPVLPGDRLSVNYFIEYVEEKRSQFGGGTAAVVYHRKEYLNQRGELVAVYRYYFWFAEREASEKTGKYMGVEPKTYTQEELDEIDAAYANEFRRGADTLYWEDVSEADEMPTMVKGPLSTVEIIGWHQGWGWGVFQVAPLRLGYLNRQRIPTFYPKNDYGYYDVAQRVHWEDKRANKVGAPRSYDYGMMRTSWIIHYCTNWMGDDGFLWKQSDQTRKFNFHGDTQWVRAKVAGKRREGELNIVDLEVWCENQRGEVATPGTASVLLPSRDRGPVQLPVPGGEPTPMKTDYAVDTPGCVW